MLNLGPGNQHSVTTCTEISNLSSVIFSSSSQTSLRLSRRASREISFLGLTLATQIQVKINQIQSKCPLSIKTITSGPLRTKVSDLAPRNLRPSLMAKSRMDLLSMVRASTRFSTRVLRTSICRPSGSNLLQRCSTLRLAFHLRFVTARHCLNVPILSKTSTSHLTTSGCRYDPLTTSEGRAPQFAH